MARIPDHLTAAQRAAYVAGWNAAHRGTDTYEGWDRWIAKHGTATEDEWMDGYEDRAAGRERWHYPRCRLAGGPNNCDEH